MKLRVAQAQKYVKDSWWEWSVWIDGPDEELDEVEEVTYKLHPTFTKPVRCSTDRKSKFKLKTAGWGVFPVPSRIEAGFLAPQQNLWVV
jgi:transcription initiation factor IIF auxiliary subunit